MLLRSAFPAASVKERFSYNSRLHTQRAARDSTGAKKKKKKKSDKDVPLPMSQQPH